jgi:hypothetical protein
MVPMFLFFDGVLTRRSSFKPGTGKNTEYCPPRSCKLTCWARITMMMILTMTMKLMVSRQTLWACWILGIGCNRKFVCIALHAYTMLTGTYIGCGFFVTYFFYYLQNVFLPETFHLTLDRWRIDYIVIRLFFLSRLLWLLYPSPYLNSQISRMTPPNATIQDYLAISAATIRVLWNPSTV